MQMQIQIQIERKIPYESTKASHHQLSNIWETTFFNGLRPCDDYFFVWFSKGKKTSSSQIIYLCESTDYALRITIVIVIVIVVVTAVNISLLFVFSMLLCSIGSNRNRNRNRNRKGESCEQDWRCSREAAGKIQTQVRSRWTFGSSRQSQEERSQ